MMVLCCCKQNVTVMHPRGVMLWPFIDLGIIAEGTNYLNIRISVPAEEIFAPESNNTVSL